MSEPTPSLNAGAAGGRWTPGPAWLFCPADRPERYPKALAAADVVILDLEDAVAPDRRAHGRDALRILAHDGILDRDRTVVRISAAGTIDHAPDRSLVERIGIQRVMLAKAESPVHLATFPQETIPLLETPLGIENAAALAAVGNVVAVMWGADDLVAGLGGSASRYPDGRYRDIAGYARSRALLAAKAHGRLALDGVHLDIPDLDGLAVECEDAVAVGFDATVAIHPSQVPVIRATYRPSDERVDWARRLFAHVGNDRGVTTFEGRMVDGPIYAQAAQILRRADLTSGER